MNDFKVDSSAMVDSFIYLKNTDASSLHKLHLSPLGRGASRQPTPGGFGQVLQQTLKCQRRFHNLLK